MPPPLSYITITNPPLNTIGVGFAYQVQVAEFNVANEIWFRYDTGADPQALGWFNGLATGFVPATNLYEDDGTTLINGNVGDNAMWWPIANNSTYYIRVRNSLGGGIGFPFNCLFEGALIGLTTVPDGSWIVNDDSDQPGGNDGFPSAVYSPAGVFIGFISGIPAGEIGDSLPSGESLWHDRFGMYGGELALFDNNFGFVDDFTAVPSLGARFPCICNDGTKFFILNRDTNDVFTITSAGVMSATIESLTFINDIQALGVSRDGLILYYAQGYDSAEITKAIIGGAESVLYTIPGFAVGVDYIALSAVNEHPGEILVLQDGTLATWWRDFSTLTGHILHLSAAGALLHDVAFDEATYGILDHIHYSPNGAGFVHAWFFTNGSANQGRFGEVTFATGTFSQLFETDLLSSGENLIGGSGTIFGPSASCTLVTFVYPGTEVPPIDSEITVIKQIINGIDGDNDIEFQLTAVGMSPISFTLKNGESITFSGLPDGTYGVSELTDSGFISEYVVSNADNNNSITVTAGDSVTVTVVNTRFTAGGIYKIQPLKRNDTLWTDVEANETLDVKIPNPIAKSAFFG